MNLEQLKQESKRQVVPVVQDDDDDDVEYEDQTVVDLKSAVELLKSSKTMLDYLADGQLIRAISKRERVVIEKLSTRVAEFVSEVEEGLEEV